MSFWTSIVNGLIRKAPAAGPPSGDRPPKYAPGQRVRVRLNERNRTPHEGTIRAIVWHFKERRDYYYLEEGGKKISKRYRDDDLEPVESSTKV